MTEEAVKEKINFGSSSSNSESAEKVRIQESSNIEDNAQEALSGTGRSIEAGSTENFENVYVAGTVGIGVASPSEKLEVSGIIKAIAFVGDGSEITALDGKKITTGIIEDSRIPSTISRENRFDPTNGHKHTGAAGDGPIISHSKLDEALPANPDSSDTATNKHISDALAKGWQDHITIKSGNPHGTTAIDIGALPISGGAINGTLQVETLQVNGKIETTGTVDGVDISNCFDPSKGHKHTGAAGDGPIISHSRLDNILEVDTSSPDNIANKHVSDVLAKNWQDHVMIKSGNPHGMTAADVKALSIDGGTINGDLQVNGNIETTGTVDGVDISNCFNPSMGHKHIGADGDGPKISHSNLDNILVVNTSSPDTTANKHVSDALAKSWQDHVTGKSGNPHNVTVEEVGALPINGGTINGTLQVNGNVGIGTTNPKDKLDVHGTIRLSGKNAFEGYDTFLRINDKNEFSSGTTFPYRVHFYRGITTGSWYNVDPNGNILVQGNVGIGTTNPSARLEVNGNIKVIDSEMQNLIVKDKVGIGTTDLQYGLDVKTSNIRLRVGENNSGGQLIIKTRSVSSIPDSAKVTLYEHGNYAGRNIQLPVGDYNTQYLKDRGFCDNLSSLRVPEGLKVTLYDNENFKTDQGTLEITKDTPGLNNFNDRTASIRIRLLDFPSKKSAVSIQALDLENKGIEHLELTGSDNNKIRYLDLKVENILISGSLSVSGNLSVSESLSVSGTKNFSINHPTKSDCNLVHSTLEGPEAAVFYRGEGQLLDGEKTVILPDYFEDLTREENRTVLLTPKFEDGIEISMLATSEVKDGKFTVKTIDNKNPSQKFYWEVKAVRADVEKLEVEQIKTSFNSSI